MKFSSFIKLVELPTKVASVIPFLIGSLFAATYFGEFHVLPFAIMFVSLLSVDMFTTAINNYMDYKRAIRKHGFNYEEHNSIVRDNLKESTVRMTIGILLAIAIIFGLILVLLTDYIVLLIGIASFAVGVLYSYGPLPISKTPLGEAFSGGFMGVVLIFLSTYIHLGDMNVITFSLDPHNLSLGFNLDVIIPIVVVSIPATMGIANIMLANNICDVEDDLENLRYTLPIYIGRPLAITLFKVMYLVGFMAIVTAVILNYLPMYGLILLVLMLPVFKQAKAFGAAPTKQFTFINSVKNFVLMNVALILVLFADLFI